MVLSFFFKRIILPFSDSRVHLSNLIVKTISTGIRKVPTVVVHVLVIRVTRRVGRGGTTSFLD